jgi:hypothetical protein
MTRLHGLALGAGFVLLSTLGAQAQYASADYGTPHTFGTYQHSLGGPLVDAGGCWTNTDRDRGYGYYTTCDRNAPNRVADRANNRQKASQQGGN